MVCIEQSWCVEPRIFSSSPRFIWWETQKGNWVRRTTELFTAAGSVQWNQSPASGCGSNDDSFHVQRWLWCLHVAIPVKSQRSCFKAAINVPTLQMTLRLCHVRSLNQHHISSKCCEADWIWVSLDSRACALLIMSTPINTEYTQLGARSGSAHSTQRPRSVTEMTAWDRGRIKIVLLI